MLWPYKAVAMNFQSSDHLGAVRVRATRDSPLPFQPMDVSEGTQQSAERPGTRAAPHASDGLAVRLDWAATTRQLVLATSRRRPLLKQNQHR